MDVSQLALKRLTAARLAFSMSVRVEGVHPDILEIFILVHAEFQEAAVLQRYNVV